MYMYSFIGRFYLKQLTIAIYVRGHTPLGQLGVKCLAQGHIGHTKGMCLIHCATTTPITLNFFLKCKIKHNWIHK